MAVAFDAASFGNNPGAFGVTFSHTCTGSERFLLVIGEVANGTADLTATYNGVSMTDLGATAGSASRRVFYLVNPASGANNVVMTNTVGSGVVLSVAVSYTGVNQTTPFNGLQTATTNAGTVAVTVASAVANLVVGGCVSGSNAALTLSASGGQTERVNQAYRPSATGLVQIISDQAGAASVSHGYTINTTPNYGRDTWAINLIASGGGSAAELLFGNPRTRYGY